MPSIHLLASGHLLGYTEELQKFIKFLCGILGLSTYCLTRQRQIDQSGRQTCGTLVLLHLGISLGLWTPAHHPDEFRLHLHLLKQYAANGKTSGGDDRELIWALRDILKNHGVPDNRTEERATLAMDKIGIQAVRAALNSKNPWQQLKMLGSQPKVNMLLMKPDELEAQIRHRATQFRVQASDKKSKGRKTTPAEVDIDPAQLTMLTDTFAYAHDADLEVRQLPMAEVASHKAGLAFGRIADVLPFIKEGTSITLDALAVLTTSRIPPEHQGLLPVTNLRFPALYAPTQQPILLDGSLVQLGDLTITRKADDAIITTTPISTGVVRLTLYKDETTQNWEGFVKSPMRLLMQQFPQLAICNGQRCGGICPKYHPPVDVEMDSVILDIWSRSWWTHRGRRATPSEADMFQALLRIPDVLIPCSD